MLRIRQKYNQIKEAKRKEEAAHQQTASMSENVIKVELFTRLYSIPNFQSVYLNYSELMLFVIHIMWKVQSKEMKSYGLFLQKHIRDFISVVWSNDFPKVLFGLIQQQIKLVGTDKNLTILNTDNNLMEYQVKVDTRLTGIRNIEKSIVVHDDVMIRKVNLKLILSIPMLHLTI